MRWTSDAMPKGLQCCTPMQHEETSLYRDLNNSHQHCYELTASLLNLTQRLRLMLIPVDDTTRFKSHHDSEHVFNPRPVEAPPGLCLWLLRTLAVVSVLFIIRFCPFTHLATPPHTTPSCWGRPAPPLSPSHLPAPPPSRQAPRHASPQSLPPLHMLQAIYELPSSHLLPPSEPPTLKSHMHSLLHPLT